jgi:hypothetical protein
LIIRENFSFVGHVKRQQHTSESFLVPFAEITTEGKAEFLTEEASFGALALYKYL